MEMLYRIEFRYSRYQFQFLLVDGRDACIARPLACMPDPFVVLEMETEFRRYLRLERFHFLETDDIRILLFHPVVKSLARDGAYPIDVS